MKLKPLFFLLLLFQLFQFSTIAQDNLFDSLKTALSQAKHDTSRVQLYVQLSDACPTEDIEYYANKTIALSELNLKKITSKNDEYKLYSRCIAAAYNNMGYISNEHGDLNKAMKYYHTSLKIYQEINNKQGIASAYHNMGYIYDTQGDIPKALDLYLKSLAIKKEINDLKGVAASLNNIGAVYKNLGDIPNALEYYHNCLKIQEQINNKNGIAYVLNNIGDIYDEQHEPVKAIEYYHKSLKIWEGINEKGGIAHALNSIGSMYLNHGNIPNAIINCERSLKIREEINDKQGIGYSLNYIGYIYQRQKNVPKSLDYYYKSLKIREDINDKQGICYTLNNIIEVNILLLKYRDALPYAERNFKLSQELGFPENIKAASNLLSNIYSKIGNYKGAYEMQVLYKQMTDSINNEVNKKASIQKGFQYEYEKKAAADSVKTVAERKVFNVQIKQERTQRIALSIGIGLIALFSIFMYNRFRITSKQKYIIELQKKEVDQQRELADSRRLLAEEQKEIIEEKQKEILDSIHYAKRIQQAMLTSESYFDEHLNADYFIYYQPKDIVSGDFYWAVAHHNKFYIATADCTGHGVPGAFMSLLNISFLNENVIERNLQDPAQILNEQRKEIIKALNPKGSENSKDGMDCVLCAIDITNNTLEFAAANNPVWLIRNNELTEYKADKMPVGKYEDNAKDFKSQSIAIQKGDLTYTFTDGYADQFGGPKGKKFKYKQLENLLLANHHLPMDKQRELLSQTINDWKGNNEQVDDILVIGVRI
jgi:serine phosphatase RsbU (regulator of sigma subunit)